MADFTKLINAETEAEVDKYAAELNAELKKGKSVARLEFLDEVRGFCLLVMMAYHLFFIMGFLFDFDFGRQAHEFMRPFTPVFSTLFILIAGFCVRYSKDLSKRGLKLAIFALLISLFTIVLLPRFGIEDMIIWFGILHLLAIAKLLMAVWNKLFGKIPTLLGLPLSLLLFHFTSTVGERYFSFFGHLRLNLPAFLYETNWLLPLGFHSESFTTWDYFPLLPFLFMFLFGVFLGRLASDKLPKFCFRRMIVPLGWLGRHSLVVYLLHMPVFYFAIYVFNLLT